MLTKKTVFIVGAGASVEAGLPTGAELTRQIASMLDMRWDRSAQAKGDRLLGDTLKYLSELENGRGNWNIKDQVHAARRIAAAMVESLSIDNYMEAHSNDPNVMLVGKLAIARAIGSAERGSILWFDKFRGQAFDPAKAKETWYQKFWQILHQGITSETVERIFDNLTIVSFNYDRCIQQRLFFGLINYYNLSESQALSLVSKLRILYPYGSLGQYQGPSSFGIDYTPDLLAIVSKELKTFSEQIEDEECVNAIKAAVSEAERLVFLGFAFHPQNMRMITAPSLNTGKLIYATAFAIPPANMHALRDAISEVVGYNVSSQLDFNKCYDFFNNYWYYLFDS